MRIIYSVDDRLGAAQPLKDFIGATKHEVKVAAYPRSGRLLPCIDWNLHAAKKNIAKLQQDVKKYYPDFVLIDGEPILANIAYKLDIPILYCSSLHLLDGLVWRRNQRDCSAVIEQLRRKLTNLPPGVGKLIYAPFGDLESCPQIKDEFEWIQPYHVKTKTSGNNILSIIEDLERNKELQKIYESSRLLKIVTDDINNDSYLSSLTSANTILIEGSARQVADGVYNQKRLIFCPKAKNPEDVLNSTICANLQIATNLGQIELAELLALEQIEKTTRLVTSSPNIVREHKKLHERIDELWECM